MRRTAAMAVLLSAVLPCFADEESADAIPPSQRAAVQGAELPPSIARAYVQSLAARKQLPASGTASPIADQPALLDEIVIYGQVDPEDFVRRRSKFLAFRDRLTAERPMTPKERTQALLCLIGLCGVYGPDGLPMEPTNAQRNEARTRASTTRLNSMFRGTLQ